MAMVIRLIFTFALALLAAGSPSSVLADGLEARIVPLQKVYKAGEPILVEFRLHNTWVWERDQMNATSYLVTNRIIEKHTLFLTVSDLDGMMLEYRGNVFQLPRVSHSSFFHLWPSRFMGYQMDLALLYSLTKPGRYRIRGYFEDHSVKELFENIEEGYVCESWFPREDYWSGRLDLPEIEIIVE